MHPTRISTLTPEEAAAARHLPPRIADALWQVLKDAKAIHGAFIANTIEGNLGLVEHFLNEAGAARPRDGHTAEGWGAPNRPW